MVLQQHKRRTVHHRQQFDCPGEIVRRSIEDRRGLSSTNHLIARAIVAIEPFDQIPGVWAHDEFVEKPMRSLLRQGRSGRVEVRIKAGMEIPP